MTQLVSDWKDLVGLESNTYCLQIDEYGCYGHIRRKSDNLSCEYLTPHSFYGPNYQITSAILQEYGFDIQLENWDGETDWIDISEQWKYRGRCNLCQRLKECTKIENGLCPAAQEWMENIKSVRELKCHR